MEIIKIKLNNFINKYLEIIFTIVWFLFLLILVILIIYMQIDTKDFFSYLISFTIAWFAIYLTIKIGKNSQKTLDNINETVIEIKNLNLEKDQINIKKENQVIKQNRINKIQKENDEYENKLK
ncbi:hypothetical protein X271_00284 [Candidatus Hepatoplasma crinochetorum Av]|uniref:Uncharacterized protein n=1 Tax=Candidatus Hepatoplasma crinochetorum Av TaxID=1427984 RepID=W8GSL5_9MOLU|nr:hypothetical protein [Candidatus Hepatoplasma crinochetorum]AHK22390.1 hypothetical protein X271_00284 [Candidatus Hepatoplasma crinochetorum Av]